MPAGDSNSIYSSNCKAARDSETLLWRALCDEADTAMEYIEPDCVMINPLIHPEKSHEALTSESSPSLSEALEKLSKSSHRWTSYKMHKHDPEPAIAEVEMMAVQIMYRITMIREKGNRHGDEEEDKGSSLQTVDAFCTSTWRQGAGGGWKLCAQQLVPI